MAESGSSRCQSDLTPETWSRPNVRLGLFERGQDVAQATYPGTDHRQVAGGRSRVGQQLNGSASAQPSMQFLAAGSRNSSSNPCNHLCRTPQSTRGRGIFFLTVSGCSSACPLLAISGCERDRGECPLYDTKRTKFGVITDFRS